MMTSKASKLTALTLALGACGSACSSSSTPTAGNHTIASLASGVGTAQANLQKYTPATADTSPTAFNFSQKARSFASLLFPSAYATSYTPFGAQWTAMDMVDLYCGSNCTAGSESLKNYMGQEIDPNFQNANGSTVGAAGRLQSALFQSCVMMYFMGTNCTADTDGLPAVGTCSASVDLSSLPAVGQSFNGCIVPEGMGGGGGGALTINITVEAVSGNANYTKKITMAGIPSGNGTGTGTIYAKLNKSTGVLNFESMQPGDNQTGSASCGGSRFIMALNGGVTQFEYTSVTLASDVAGSTCSAGGSASHEDYYRVHIDTDKDQAYILGLGGANNGSVSGRTFVLSGQPSKIATNSGSIGVSIWADDGTAIPTGATTFIASSADACVAQSTGDITTDGTLACDITGLDVATARTMLTARQTTDFSNTTNPLLSVGTPGVVGWTDASDFLTGQTVH